MITKGKNINKEKYGYLMHILVLILHYSVYLQIKDTLIVWSELDNDYAISFQEKAGCDEIWEKICQVSYE